MNYSGRVQSLWERIKQPSLQPDALSALLADYQQTLEEISASDEELRGKLRLQREELPDLQRLITRKHDAILQGRLQDAIGKMKKLVAAPEAPPAETPGNPEQAASDIPGRPGEEARKPFRNMPNIGMD